MGKLRPTLPFRFKSNEIWFLEGRLRVLGRETYFTDFPSRVLTMKPLGCDSSQGLSRPGTKGFLPFTTKTLLFCHDRGREEGDGTGNVNVCRPIQNCLSKQNAH